MDLMFTSSIQLNAFAKASVFSLLHVTGEMYAGSISVCCSNGGYVATVSDAFILSSGREVRCHKKAKSENINYKTAAHTIGSRTMECFAFQRDERTH